MKRTFIVCICAAAIAALFLGPYFYHAYKKWRTDRAVALLEAVQESEDYSIYTNDSKLVAHSDPIYPFLAQKKRDWLSAEANFDVGRKFGDWINVDDASLRQLFPHLRFASIEWDEYQKPEQLQYTMASL